MKLIGYKIEICGSVFVRRGSRKGSRFEVRVMNFPVGDHSHHQDHRHLQSSLYVTSIEGTLLDTHHPSLYLFTCIIIFISLRHHTLFTRPLSLNPPNTTYNSTANPTQPIIFKPLKIRGGRENFGSWLLRREISLSDKKIPKHWAIISTIDFNQLPPS